MWFTIATIFDYPMASENLTDENTKGLHCFLWIFEPRIAITIMTNQHKRHDYEDITVIEKITQL